MKNPCNLIAENLSNKKTEYCDEWFTSEQAADFLGLSASRLYNLTSSGKIPYYKLCRSNRYKKSELEYVLSSRPRGERNGY